MTRMKSFADGVGESVVSVGGRAARCGAGETIGAEVGPKESVIARSPMKNRTYWVRAAEADEDVVEGGCAAEEGSRESELG